MYRALAILITTLLGSVFLTKMNPKSIRLVVILSISLMVVLSPVHADQSAGSLPSGGSNWTFNGRNNPSDDLDGKAGVCFTASTSGLVSHVDFYLGRTAGATGSIEAQLYSTTGAIARFPTPGTGCASLSTLIASSTTSISMSSLGTSPSLQTFSFASPSISSGNKYIAVIHMTFTNPDPQSIFINLNSGGGNPGMAWVDNVGTVPQGNLNQNANDYDEFLCDSVSSCPAFNVVVGASPPDFTVSANPTAITLSQDHSATSTITVSSLSGFSGNVALSANAPAGFTATLNPTTVSLTSGGTATSTLTITATGTQISGTYTVTVTGSSGTLSHQTAVSVSYTVGGNLLSNPGFETGSFASWSQTGMIIRGDAGSMHSGLYGAAPAYNPSTQIYSAFTLQQNLPSAVAGSSITKIQLWYRWGTSADSVQVLYTDGTYTQTNLPFVGSWTLVNAAFDSTKAISGIKVVRTSGQTINLNLDDFVLG